jgi:hypothetical protein
MFLVSVAAVLTPPGRIVEMSAESRVTEISAAESRATELPTAENRAIQPEEM